ncbi:hypothetical protein BKA70DRAFT_1395320 [Coprinopsis sp. MPI-PUGE-AT-0042]|nr:hypothetical protein BKA70DRAFT_1395320 [Coprinopsis sp. MPI-PUGE-AT-0042]
MPQRIPSYSQPGFDHPNIQVPFSEPRRQSSTGVPESSRTTSFDHGRQEAHNLQDANDAVPDAMQENPLLPTDRPTMFSRCTRIHLNNCQIISCAGAYSHEVSETIPGRLPFPATQSNPKTQRRFGVGALIYPNRLAGVVLVTAAAIVGSICYAFETKSNEWAVFIAADIDMKTGLEAVWI